ncbi:fas-associated protein [Anaeramoeba flamelloides]|uniref:Fas-associated protein n=1 Tax=Anaeramoeba flamelloides TaxID=1746091 RepID=A0ABQ8ZFE4_9EUKA|nr:fas-associated protein [Anaeramoeba flamelloides]
MEPILLDVNHETKRTIIRIKPEVEYGRLMKVLSYYTHIPEENLIVMGVECEDPTIPIGTLTTESPQSITILDREEINFVDHINNSTNDNNNNNRSILNQNRINLTSINTENTDEESLSEEDFLIEFSKKDFFNKMVTQDIESLGNDYEKIREFQTLTNSFFDLSKKKLNSIRLNKNTNKPLLIYLHDSPVSNKNTQSIKILGEPKIEKFIKKNTYFWVGDVSSQSTKKKVLKKLKIKNFPFFYIIDLQTKKNDYFQGFCNSKQFFQFLDSFFKDNNLKTNSTFPSSSDNNFENIIDFGRNDNENNNNEIVIESEEEEEEEEEKSSNYLNFQFPNNNKNNNNNNINNNNNEEDQEVLKEYYEFLQKEKEKQKEKQKKDEEFARKVFLEQLGNNSNLISDNNSSSNNKDLLKETLINRRKEQVSREMKDRNELFGNHRNQNQNNLGIDVALSEFISPFLNNNSRNINEPFSELDRFLQNNNRQGNYYISPQNSRNRNIINNQTPPKINPNQEKVKNIKNHIQEISNILEDENPKKEDLLTSQFLLKEELGKDYEIDEESNEIIKQDIQYAISQISDKILEIQTQESIQKEEEEKNNKENEKLRIQNKQKKRLLQLPPEPNPEKKDSITIQIRIKGFENKVRTFKSSTLLKYIFYWVESINPELTNFELIQSYPKTIFKKSMKNDTLSNLNFEKRVVLYAQEKN